MTLRQDLSSITKGLGASFRMGYDKVASYWKIIRWNTNMVVLLSLDGRMENLATLVTMKPVRTLKWQEVVSWTVSIVLSTLVANVDGTASSVITKFILSLMYTYKYDNNVNINSTLYHCNWSWYTHYGLKDRYFLDFALVASASNLLETGSNGICRLQWAWHGPYQ